MSSGSDNEPDASPDPVAEAANAILSASSKAAKRASVLDGLKGFQVNYKPEATAAEMNEAAAAKTQQRRNTLGAALKGFQINLQNNPQDNNDKVEENIAGLTKNLPKLSIGSVKQQQHDRKRRESAYAIFMNKDSIQKDHPAPAEGSKG